MELVERSVFFSALQKQFSGITTGEGHSVFLSGEAGMGKTSLVKLFFKSLKKEYPVYEGTCDALFTPRPLAPLYDILPQLMGNDWKTGSGITERTALFTAFFHELGLQQKPCLVVFEDIHWADEATFDFIKFFARRISQLHCLFICTYRDDEIQLQHPLRNVLGQLAADSFTRIQLPPLSRQAVEAMALQKGFNGQEVYSISGGNPFYVNEILASYSTGVPDNIKDSILSVYNRQDAATRMLWEILSVLPTGFEMNYIEKLDLAYITSVEDGLASHVLVLKDNLVYFKHELYRRTIETALSPLKRVALNKKILDLFRENFETRKEIERIIHHAKNANEYDLVVSYAPLAARKAAAVGAHIEASRLYLSAIEYYQGSDPNLLIDLYESYAYECYLTNQIKEAIIYTGKAMQIWKEKNNIEKTGNSLRFLSRLGWFDGYSKNAEIYSEQAIAALEGQPVSKVKAMAYSNMSQLKMLADQVKECIFWGEKAIAMAKELGDEEILCHAFNNVGTVQMKIPAMEEKGTDMLQQSLSLALTNAYHEHAARAFTNLVSNTVSMKKYALAKKALDDGIRYCEEKDLDSWSNYMISLKARMLLETGHWKEALTLAENLLKNERQAGINKIVAQSVAGTIKTRKGDPDTLPLLLKTKAAAFETMESQRILPVMVALLEYEWINSQPVLEQADIEQTKELLVQKEVIMKKNEFAFWLQKAGRGELPLKEIYEGYNLGSAALVKKAADCWAKIGCPYEQALALFQGTDDNKREAIAIVQALGADAVYEKMKREMRASGIKSIPRGARKTTLSNAALLTDREMDILQLLQQNMQNKEIAARLFISAKTVDHHISSILFKLDVNTRARAVQEAIKLEIIK